MRPRHPGRQPTRPASLLLILLLLAFSSQISLAVHQSEPQLVVCAAANEDSASNEQHASAGMLEEINDVLGKLQLSVDYGGEGDGAVKAGELLSKGQAAHAPTVTFDGDAAKYYALLMVDPDAPAPDNPIMSEWLHWAVVNIPGGDVGKGFTVMDYAGPTPPQGTHRYIFLLHEQPQGVTLPQQRLTDRKKFNAARWASQHKLPPPAAAAFFRTAAESH